MIVLLVILLALRITSGGFDFMDMLLSLPGIIIGLSFHEFAHGAVSYALGDPTPKLQGRLTINPMAHMDPFGFLALMFAGFGWGIPVQIDPRYYKNRRRDEMLVGLAGVTMNLLLAILFSLILRFLFSANPAWLSGEVGTVLTDMLIQVVLINLVLMVFNLIPVPPLDGFNIIAQIFNFGQKEIYWQIYRYGNWILVALIVFGVTGMILSPCVSFLFNLLVNTILL